MPPVFFNGNFNFGISAFFAFFWDPLSPGRAGTTRGGARGSTAGDAGVGAAGGPERHPGGHRGRPLEAAGGCAAAEGRVEAKAVAQALSWVQNVFSAEFCNEDIPKADSIEIIFIFISRKKCNT